MSAVFDVTDIHEGDFVRVRMRTSETILGVVVRLDGDFLMLKEYVDFTYWGYKFVVSSYIVEVSREEPVDRLAKIVAAERMGEVADEYRFLIQLATISEFLEGIRESRRVCVFHENEDTLSLGRLVKIADGDLYIQCIDRNFRVEETPFAIPKNSVSMIEIGSEYLRIYRDYSQ